MSEKKPQGRVLQGVVTSNKMNKTIVVKVERRVTHPLYNKVVTKVTKLHVHDADELGKEGDLVIIQETRPISKTKSWVLVEVLEKAS